MTRSGKKCTQWREQRAGGQRSHDERSSRSSHQQHAAGVSEADYLDQLDTRWAGEPADLDTPLYQAISLAKGTDFMHRVFGRFLA